MTEIIFDKNAIILLAATIKEEDLNPKGRLKNLPPSDRRCDVCGLSPNR